MNRWTVRDVAGEGEDRLGESGLHRRTCAPPAITQQFRWCCIRHLSLDRKRPRLFLDVVEQVHRQLPLRVSMRRHESHLVSELAMSLSQKDWYWVGPLTATRVSYWEALAGTTAFLATAVEESYGLEYVEAMAAGVIGVLPDAPWARALVPEGYPFLWSSPAQAVELLKRALTDPEGCTAELNALAEGDFTTWIARRHDDTSFEDALTERLNDWFD